VVLAHYLVAINSHGMHTHTIDVSKYENYLNHGHNLEKFIDKLLMQTGDDSFVALKELMRLDDLDLESVIGFQKNGDDMLENLAHYPALLSHFPVYNSFVGEPRILQYLTKTPGETIHGYHAMIIVGARKDPSGEYYYLLQNWWKGKYFVEVSARYLDSVKPAFATFVLKKVVDYPEVYEGLTNDFLSAETLDRPESPVKEDL